MPSSAQNTTVATGTAESTTDATDLTSSSVQWIDHVSRLDGVPGEFRRHGRYLYVKAVRADGVLADGHPVDGLQLVRTSPVSPTRLEVAGLVLEGVEQEGSLGVRVVEDPRAAPVPRKPVSDLYLS
jgi:hypothetical protein